MHFYEAILKLYAQSLFSYSFVLHLFNISKIKRALNSRRRTQGRTPKTRDKRSHQAVESFTDSNKSMVWTEIGITYAGGSNSS